MEFKIISRLPEEIIEEILSRVAVKSLLRFRCVSKTWKSTIDSKRFIGKHMRNSTSCSGPRVIVASESGKLWQCCASSISSKPELEESKLKFGGTIRSISLVGCFAGVVCVLLNVERYMLWNPSTRISKKLPLPPPPRLRPYGYGFCYDERSRGYKVVHISGGANLNPRPVKIYSSKSKSWEEKSDPWKDRNGVVVECYGQGKAASGKLHWVCGDYMHGSSDIIAFDVSRGVEGDSVKKPEHDAVGLMRRRLGKLGECLSLVCIYRNRFDVWVMKEYAVKESWQKVMKVDHQPRDRLPTPLCIGPEGEITFLERGSFFTCYRDGWSKRMDKLNTSFQAASNIYFETLLKF